MSEDDTEEKQEIKCAAYAKKFKASEELMKSDFLPKYRLAKSRLRAEHEVKGRGTRKLTHEQVNLVYSIGTNFVNSVYFKTPNVNFTARDYNQHDNVENTEKKTNDWLKDKRVKSVVKRSIWDAFNGGFGAVYTDYEYDDMDDDTRPVMRTETVIGEDGIPVTQQIPETGEDGQALFERIVLRNDITIQRIRPDLVRFPRGFDFDNAGDSPWIGFDLILPIDEVKNNADWDEEARIKIEGSRYEKISMVDERGTSKGQDEDLYAKVSYCFIRPDYPDFQPYKLLIFSCDYDEKPLKVMEFKKGHKGYPIKFIYFNPLDDDCPYPNGDPWNIESQLNAVDEWWKKLFRHIRRSNPKIIYDSGSLTTQEAQKLKSNNDNEVVGISNKQQRDLRALITELNSTQVNPDLHRLWEVARQLLDQIAPRTSASQGMSNAGTATEAKIEHSGEMIDIDARIDDVKTLLEDICRDVAGILENIAAPVSAPVVMQDQGGKKTTSYQDLPAERFSSNAEIDIDVESMQSQNKDVVRRQLIDAMGLFTKLAPLMEKPTIDEHGQMVPPKTLYIPFWIEQLMDTMNIRNIEKGFVDLPQMLPQGPIPGQAVDDGFPPQDGPTGDMPPEAIEAGLAQRL